MAVQVLPPSERSTTPTTEVLLWRLSGPVLDGVTAHLSLSDLHRWSFLLFSERLQEHLFRYGEDEVTPLWGYSLLPKTGEYFRFILLSMKAPDVNVALLLYFHKMNSNILSLFYAVRCPDFVVIFFPYPQPVFHSHLDDSH